ncbi:mitochondrial inner membrane protein Mba1 [Lipomyces oligophaga]|uniref:mitochondrial inner membrane protein Mba1 n=1 Tax=Lipomyces oligophaga TaxID=45792 RepID=UPI0034CDF823
MNVVKKLGYGQGHVYRHMLSSRIVTRSFQRNYASVKSSSASNTAYIVGAVSQEYIPPTGANLPKLFQQPKLYFRSLQRKAIYIAGYTFRYCRYLLKYRKRPSYSEWREDAVQTYIAVNKAFAENNVNQLQEKSSMYVYESLKDRLANMDKNWKLSWDLVEFLEKPKLITLNAIEEGNDRLLQLVYRFHTIQELQMSFPSNPKVPTKTQRQSSLDYIVFVSDLDSGEMRLSGSLFETPLLQPLANSVAAQSVLFKDMQANGDIFRRKPTPPNFDQLE